MDKEDVLAKSRAENRERDMFEREVLREGGYAGAIVSALLAFSLCTIRVIFGCGIDYGLWAVIAASFAANFTVKARRRQRRHERLVAAGYTFLAIALSAAYIYQVAVSAALS